MLKLTNHVNKKGILPRELKEGQIAIVVDAINSHYIGWIVRRFKDKLIILSSKNDWWNDINIMTNIYVTILPNGSTLEVSNNE